MIKQLINAVCKFYKFSLRPLLLRNYFYTVFFTAISVTTVSGVGVDLFEVFLDIVTVKLCSCLCGSWVAIQIFFIVVIMFC